MLASSLFLNFAFPNPSSSVFFNPSFSSTTLCIVLASVSKLKNPSLSPPSAVLSLASVSKLQDSLPSAAIPLASRTPSPLLLTSLLSASSNNSKELSDEVEEFKLLSESLSAIPSPMEFSVRLTPPSLLLLPPLAPPLTPPPPSLPCKGMSIH